MDLIIVIGLIFIVLFFIIIFSIGDGDGDFDLDPSRGMVKLVFRGIERGLEELSRTPEERRRIAEAKRREAERRAKAFKRFLTFTFILGVLIVGIIVVNKALSVKSDAKIAHEGNFIDGTDLLILGLGESKQLTYDYHKLGKFLFTKPEVDWRLESGDSITLSEDGEVQGVKIGVSEVSFRAQDGFRTDTITIFVENSKSKIAKKIKAGKTVDDQLLKSIKIDGHILFLDKKGAFLFRLSDDYKIGKFKDGKLRLEYKDIYKESRYYYVNQQGEQVGEEKYSLKELNNPKKLQKMIKMNDQERLTFLLKNEMNPNREQCGNERYSCVMIAAMEGNAEAIRIFSTYGANPNVKYDYETPLTVAVKNEDPVVVKALLENGADPNLTGSSISQPPMFFARLNDNLDIILLLEEAGVEYSKSDYHEDYEEFKEYGY